MLLMFNIFIKYGDRHSPPEYKVMIFRGLIIIIYFEFITIYE